MTGDCIRRKIVVNLKGDLPNTPCESTRYTPPDCAKYDYQSYSKATGTSRLTADSEVPGQWMSRKIHAILMYECRCLTVWFI